MDFYTYKIDNFLTHPQTSGVLEHAVNEGGKIPLMGSGVDYNPFCYHTSFFKALLDI